LKSRLTGYAVVGLLASLCVEVPARAESPRVNSTLRKLAAVATTQQGRAALRRYAETTSELERQGQAYLALGYREYQAGQFVAAVGDLRRAAQTGFTLSDVARYYQADAARQGGLPALAIEALEGFGANFPQSVLRFEALALQARLLLEAGQAERAISALLAEPRVRQRPDIALILADAYRAAGREIEAARAYQDVYYGFAASAEARLAAAALRQLRALLGPNFPQVSEEVQTARADTLFSRERYDDAFAEFTSLLGARPESSYSARWRVGRGRCLVRLRQYPEAVATLQATVPDDPALDALRLATLVEAHRRANDVQAMLRTLDELRSAYPQSPFLAAVLSEVGEYYVRQLDWSRADPSMRPSPSGVWPGRTTCRGIVRIPRKLWSL
jgi:tetratricopeptide (TPR) repeat protein